MRSNRINALYEDKYGYIWILSYDREPHRFDPRSETFRGIKSLDNYNDLAFTATTIIPVKSGKVWLISDNMGCICVKDSTFNDIGIFNIENGTLNGNHIYTVYEDSELNSWILSDNGLYRLSADGKMTNFFSEKTYIESEPSQHFYCVMETSDRIWFGSDKGKIWIYNKRNGQYDVVQTATGSYIRHIKDIDGDNLLITTRHDGFFIYNRQSKRIKKYNRSNLPGMPVSDILSCYIDKSKNIWFQLNYAGVSKFNLKTETIKHFQMKIEGEVSNVFPANFFIFEDKENRLWVHPRGGGFAWYDAGQDKLIPFYNEPSSPSRKFSNMMHTAFSDKQGNLWMSTRSNGLDKVIFNDGTFKTITVDPDIYSTINNDIRSIFEDRDKNLWVSTKGGKLFVYDRFLKQMGYLCNNGQIGNGTPLEGVTYCMTEDSKHNIWLGTKGEGVYKLTKAGSGYNITHYKHIENDPYSLSDNSVYSIFEDRKKRIWVGTYGEGINLLDGDGKRFINHHNDLKDYPIQHGHQVRTINSDRYGNICIGTTLGLIMFSSEFDTPNSIK